ncbi:MAG: hypothetical protein L6437_03835, partial [Kiritimatiellae bacterium]|nr:hypothetical protein [Kiritimatiellia bacterium]
DALLNIPAGFDTAGGGGLAPITDDLLRTTEGQLPREGIVGRILDVKQGSYDLQICAMTMDHASERHETAERPGPALASIPRNIAPLPYERTHTAYTLRSRADYFIAWNLRRVHEGMKDYRGGIVWHEGRIRFKEDMTLNGPVPVPFLFLCGGDHMFVTDADRGTLGIALLPEDKEFSIHGRVAPGGYVANMPNPIGYTAFFSSSDSEFFYQLQDWNKERASIDRLYIGLGRDGQKIKAGTEMSYRFMMASLNMRDRMVGNLELEDIRRTYNLDGGTNGYPFNISVGKLEDAEFFFTVKAKDNEAVFDIGPRRMICDLAFRIKGIEDNGCAAVYNHSAKYFRFVADADNTAYFQESIEKPVKIWAGNPFVCDDKAVKLCLVVDGQAKGKPPFLEVHNPTDKEIKTRVFSPEHTPVFAGMNAELTIPKGESLMVGIKGGKLILNSRIQ